jgi:hypothetical protein
MPRMNDTEREMLFSRSGFWIVLAIIAWIVIGFLAGDPSFMPQPDDVRPRGF